MPHLQCALDAPWRSSFFTTIRGQQAFEHALYQARCFLLQQLRSTEITFSMPLVQGLQLDLGQSLQLTDTLQGQVTAYEFLLDGDIGTEKARVTLASMDRAALSNPMANPMASMDCILAFGEIAYKPFASQLPQHGVLNPQNLRPEDLVKAVLYKNLASGQNELLRGQGFSSMMAVYNFLSQNRTAVQIHLQDLVSSDVLNHEIKVNKFRGCTR